MTQFRFETAQKNSVSLRSSVWQFENSMTSTVLYYRTMHAFLSFYCLKVLDKSYLKMNFLLNLSHFAKSFLFEKFSSSLFQKL